MLSIDLNNNAFLFNRHPLQFPIVAQEFIAVLNTPHRVLNYETNTVYVWDELGIAAYAKQDHLIDTIELSFKHQAYEASPKQTFQGQFHYGQHAAISYFFVHPELRISIYDRRPQQSLSCEQRFCMVSWRFKKPAH